MVNRIRKGILFSIAVAFAFPVFGIVLGSLGKGQYRGLILDNYPFFKFQANSIVYGALSGFLALIIALPLGYVFAKVSFRCKKLIFFLYVLVMLMPFQALQLPEYLVMKRLHLIDHPVAIIFFMSYSPLGVFLIRQCLVTLPDEIVEAFQMESSSKWIFMKYIVIPFAEPILITLFLIIFCETYNLVEQVRLFLPQNIESYPLSALVSLIPDNVSCAAYVFYLLPILLMFFRFENKLYGGLEYYRWK